MKRKKTLPTYSMPSPSTSIKPPAYIDKRISHEIEARHLKLMPSMGEIFRLKRGTYSEFCYVSMKNDKSRIEGIEVPRRSSYSRYMSNVAILHELGHAMDSRRLRFMSRYAQEKHAWENAEKIRDAIGYPVKDEKTGETWDNIRNAAMDTYENLHITKHDTRKFLNSTLLVWFALVIVMLIFSVPFAIMYSEEVMNAPVSFIISVLQCFLLLLLMAGMLAFLFSESGATIRDKFFGVQQSSS